MATERQSPDAILEISNLSPNNVGYIQEDPDSPDANWLMPDSNNSDTICRVSFPTPTGNPIIGADLQQFKIWVKKWNGALNPNVRIELYEDGILLSTVLADTPVSSTIGQLFSATWNANLLGTANGSLVECRIYGTKTGGAPANRATVAVGAVEWNVEYTEAGAYYHGLKVQGIGELALCDMGANPLRIRKGGITYGVALVDTSDPNASKIRIKTGAVIRAIRKYT